MTHEHWFDTLSKSAQAAPTRRRLTRALAALVPGLLLGGLTETLAGSKKHGGNGKKGKKSRQRDSKGKNKGKGKRNDQREPDPHEEGPPEPPVGPPDVCETLWPGEADQGNREYCRFMRRQCPPGGSRDFCIVEGDSTDPAKVAACCVEGGGCCGNRCCGEPRSPGRYQCCDGTCVDTWNSDDHCGGCGDEFKCLGGWGNGSQESCVNGACVCERAAEGWTRNEVCGGCFPPNSNYYCCDENGHHCPVTHECEFLGLDPSGIPSYGCV